MKGLDDTCDQHAGKGNAQGSKQSKKSPDKKDKTKRLNPKPGGKGGACTHGQRDRDELFDHTLEQVSKKYGNETDEFQRLFFTQWVPTQESTKKLVDQALYITEYRRKQKEKEMKLKFEDEKLRREDLEMAKKMLGDGYS